MKKMIFLSLCALLVYSSCHKDGQIAQKHTCFLLDIDGTPIVGKRVRYFNGRTTDIAFNEPNNLLQESKSDATGKVVFDGTYNSDLGWVNLVVEPDSVNLALNTVNISDRVDTIFFDKLVPLKLRIKSQQRFQSKTYVVATVSLSSYFPPFSNQPLLYWAIKTPIKAPFDTLINTKIPSRVLCAGSAYNVIEGSDSGYGQIISIYNAYVRDSMFLVEL